MLEILSTAQAANFLNLGNSTLEKWRCAGRGPKFIRLGTRRVGYPVTELTAWVASRPRYASTSETPTANNAHGMEQ